MQIEKTGDGRYRLFDANDEFVFGSEKFEDLYYAVPTHPSQFFRLLTESLAETLEEREAVNRIIRAAGQGDRESALEGLMKSIQEFPEP